MGGGLRGRGERGGQQIRLKAYKLMRTTMGGAGATAYRAELVPDSLSLGDKKKYRLQGVHITIYVPTGEL